jgi:peptidoglycan/LPS O-acetylase OafA/YrhL
MGIILYFLIPNTVIKQEQSESNLPITQFKRAMLPLFLLSLFIAGFLFVVYHFIEIHFFYVIAFVGMALLLSRHSPSLMVNKFWCYLGKISYSAYLIHLEILPLAKGFLQNALSLLYLDLPPAIDFILFLTTSLAGTMAVSSLTYKFIEVPGMKIGRTIISRIESKAT